MNRFFLISLMGLAASAPAAPTPNVVTVTGDSARAIRVLHGLATPDGELAVACEARADRCEIRSRNRSLRWEDDADGVPFFVEQVGFRMDTAAALFAAMPPGTPVDPMPYTSGGWNPVLEVRTLGGGDAEMSLIVQCERRRHWTECLVRKVTDR